ncbi:hypothetical protein [Algoriphagus marinus]|uniref:hypothetical protein n=1 Tax=Algoriphagus marinus TaxID=1925762 RepID=UPI000B24C677|nr:hypothetical protein [Algoriphagus marinus]
MSQPKVSEIHHIYGAVGGHGSGPAVACGEKLFHVLDFWFFWAKPKEQTTGY